MSHPSPGLAAENVEALVAAERLPRYPRTQAPPPGETFEIAPGVRWLRMPLPFALNHINLWLIEDDAGWVIVDTGFALPAVRECWTKILAELAATPRGERITRIVVTHFHPDHVGLAAWLAEQSGAPVLMTLGEYLTAHAVWQEIGGHGNEPMQRQFGRHGLSAERGAAIAAGRGGYNRGVPTLPTSYQRLFDGAVLHIGGRDWQVRVGHGHSPEHASLYCAEAGVLISGDMLLPKISTNISVFAVTPDADSLADYLASLDRLRELPAETLILPSHGFPFYGLHARVEAQHAHHDERLALLELSCSSPQCAADLLPVLFERELDAHQTMFAMGEAIAHLNRLEHAGRVRRLDGDDGVTRFVRV
ncbi:MBL fold metallo-hydrolase [Rhodocyclus tenuis]|uniref:Glyoxylase-like metal-dependent hydrolase (Beta-lactamase superfamily II) n=1 Tax=Rhodocyclus tenuis TaxID=1066 RepID=A0A840FXJ1_RHOTE|nr:MBL fold metallo-hydrolase [Rhodocyclus tenuis]MBB4246504.1 glyoxylase-like metal-dependent hydrolase (beta-lactamase superfamily II) [Rhodocyclus tenuis]